MPTRAVYSKDWYNKMAADPERYAKHLAYKRAWNAKHTRANLKCSVCGAPRKPRHRYCDRCRPEVRQYTKTVSSLRAKRRGYKRDNRGAYQRRLAKYGRAALAFIAKEGYHRRKRQEAQRDNEGGQTNQGDAR